MALFAEGQVENLDIRAYCVNRESNKNVRGSLGLPPKLFTHYRYPFNTGYKIKNASKLRKLLY